MCSSDLFPGHTIPQSKQMSCSQATVFQNHASVIFPGHMVPESKLSRVPRTQGFRIKSQLCSWTRVSKIKSQSCSQATGFHNQTSVIFPGHRVPPSNRSPVARPRFHHHASLMFPGQRVPQSNLSHLARPQCSTIKPQSYAQA